MIQVVHFKHAHSHSYSHNLRVLFSIHEPPPITHPHTLEKAPVLSLMTQLTLKAEGSKGAGKTLT